MKFKLKIMKAKHFKSIRAEAEYYKVIHSEGLFGTFWSHKFDKDSIIVLAKNPLQAVKRAKRRGYGLTYDYWSGGTDSSTARWMVKLAHKNDHWRNFSYF